MLAPSSPQLELDGKLNGLSSLTLSGKLEISLWLRQEIMNRVKSLKNAEGYESELNLDQVSVSWLFFIARDVLERLEDISILADVIGLCLTTDHAEVQSSIVETLHYHNLCFAAIGALQPLLTQVIERYQTLRNEMPLERLFLQSIADLCTTVGGDSNVIQQLNYDLARCDQRNAMVICSPASDNAGDILTSTPMDSDEDIERIFSSGNTMDEQSMSRVFKRLIIRLGESSSGSCQSRCGQWFSRLRSFDEANFDALMRTWLSSTLCTATIEQHRQMFPALVGSSCLSLSSVVQIAAERQQSIDLDDYETRGRLEMAILYAVLPFDDNQMPAILSVCCLIRR
jgi:mediator of RNA polymerase II transcription subunit 12, fungi type